jgi:hypothetical protein
MIQINNSKVTEKFTFGIDGNWLAISRWMAASRDSLLTFQPETFDADRRKFIEYLSTSLAYESIKLENVIDSIVLVTDLKAWRKQYYYMVSPWDIEAGVQPAKHYKAHRETDDSVDMAKLFEVFFEWIETVCEAYKIHWISALGSEGDDVISILSTYLNVDCAKNFMFNSTDKDLIQINKYNSSNDAMTLYYRVRTSGYKETRKTESVITTTKKNISLLAMKSKQHNDKIDVLGDSALYMTKVSTNPYQAIIDIFDDLESFNMGEFVATKILTGDGCHAKTLTDADGTVRQVTGKGDGVPPFIYKDTAKGKKEHFKMTEKHVKVALDVMGLTDQDLANEINFDDVFMTTMINESYKSLHSSKKEPNPLPPTPEMMDWYKARWRENRHLMMLHNDELPPEVLETAFDAIKKSELKLGTRIQDAQQLPVVKGDILKLFGIIESDNAMSLHEDQLMSMDKPTNVLGSPNMPSTPMSPSTPNSNPVETIAEPEFNIDSIVNTAMNG